MTTCEEEKLLPTSKRSRIGTAASNAEKFNYPGSLHADKVKRSDGV
ncbi:hypothetical protein [Stenotrophomonas phage CM2]